MTLRVRGNAFFSNVFALFEKLGCKKMQNTWFWGILLVSYGLTRSLPPAAGAFFCHFLVFFSELWAYAVLASCRRRFFSSTFWDVFILKTCFLHAETIQKHVSQLNVDKNVFFWQDGIIEACVLVKNMVLNFTLLKTCFLTSRNNSKTCFHL